MGLPEWNEIVAKDSTYLNENYRDIDHEMMKKVLFNHDTKQTD